MIKEYLENNLTDRAKEKLNFNGKTMQALMKSWDRQLVFGNPSIGLVKWAKEDQALVVNLTYLLDKLGIATTKVSKAFNEMVFNIQLLDKDAVESWRLKEKIKLYAMREDTNVYPDNLTKVNGKLIDTGLVRKGFAKVAKRTFTLDTQYLKKYRRPIMQNLVKGITKSVEKGTIGDKFWADSRNYLELAELMLEYYTLDDSRRYNFERNLGESRGRSNLQIQKRIGNPITYKDFRAIMRVPKEDAKIIKYTDTEILDDIYYFIAELCGNKATTEQGIINAGKQHYADRHLPRLNLTTEKGRKDLHELIWLERIYSKLDTLYKLGFVVWDIPLEIDARMCVAQFYGALTNDKDILESVALIDNGIKDPWDIGVPRPLAKLLVAVLYGSSQTSRALIKAKGEEVDEAVVKKMNNARATGRFAVMEAYKNALINHYTVEQPVVRVKLWKQEFDVHINKFKVVGSKPVVTQAYDSKSKRFKVSVTHEPITVPDYGRMKLYWATCKVHGLESQVFDEMAFEEPEWLVTNHDAILTLPGTAKRQRIKYAQKMKAVNNDRFQITRDYRKSIGATDYASDVAFYKAFKLVNDAGDVEFSPSAMK